MSDASERTVAPTPAEALRVLAFTLNYAPEVTGFGRHVAALAEALSAHGHAVTVVTGFPFSPGWKRWPEYRGPFMRREIRRGVDVLRLTHFIPRRPGRMMGRVMMEASFCVMTLVALARYCVPKSNVIFYCGAQPSLAMLARVLARLLGVPYVVSIQDLAAQAAADVAIVGPGRLGSLLERFEFAAYRGSSMALVLCEAFREALVAHGYERDRIVVLRSPTDIEHIRPVEPAAAFRGAHGIGPDDFVVLSAGSMGLKQGLPNVVEAARLLRPRDARVHWVLIGDGQTRPALEHLIDQHALSSFVHLLPLQPEEDVPGVFAAADVLLLNQIRSVKDTVIPSKLLAYLAAGKPVLAAVNPGSQGAQLLAQAGGGIVVEPESPTALAGGVDHLRSAGAPELRRMGRLNRAFAEQHLDERRIVLAQESILLQVVFGR
jgi:colanic acid biosynthesis glycosyl transferase WcaI